VNKKSGEITVHLDIGDIVAILQKLSPSNEHEEHIAEKLKYYMALGIFGDEDLEFE
jgi:hypothetical protein